MHPPSKFWHDLAPGDIVVMHQFPAWRTESSLVVDHIAPGPPAIWFTDGSSVIVKDITIPILLASR